MPEKREKEPIRHLYESHNIYRNQISTIEKGEVQSGPGTAAFWGVVDAAANVSPRAVSPTYNYGNTLPNQGHFKRSLGVSDITEADSSTTSSQEEVIISEVSLEDLASLKAEKAKLHQMLRSYQKDIFETHKRQVSSAADMRPAATRYCKYKEVKKAIAQKSSTLWYRRLPRTTSPFAQVTPQEFAQPSLEIYPPLTDVY